MTNLSEYMAKAFKTEGVKHIFGYPGGATLDIMEAADKEGIKFVLPRSEWSAAYMASITGEITGVPGIVLSTLGPGATNLVNGVSHAYLDRNPLIAITGRLSTGAGNTNHQLLNQVSIFEPVTKWASTLHAASGASHIRRAFHVSKMERPGPVHLDLPKDQGTIECEGEFGEPTNSINVTYGDLSDPTSLIKRLENSKHPILLVGPSAIRHHSSDALTKLAENWGIPVATTAKAKGIIDERHVYSIGSVDMIGAKTMKEFVRQTDLILAVGFDAVELIGKWEVNVPVVHIDSVPNTDYVYFADTEIIGNIPKILNTLADAAGTAEKWSEKEVKEFRNEFVSKLTPPLNGAGLSPSSVVQTARETLPEDTIVVTDTGSHKMLLGQLWSAYSPKSYYVSNGIGTMGFGIPGAIAAKMNFPAKPVICFTGDGGFAMVSSELKTAVEQNCPIIVIVFKDGKLDRILRKQEATNLDPVGTTITNPDFTKLAESYGANGVAVSTNSELAKAIENALGQNVPTLIHVPVNVEEYAIQFGL
ncbi:thiamine pyrophosphate-binding protein [Oceanobacillus jeddahense]|uniref:thiamine pyrophosphate-binding protein n=1 Tax=Oceanobacillus jeddahense TaxID=1462527 RepID=UPI0005961795|nr:thiamine pyrophosphate-binding protein [Oceanobacillus jeddahense]